MLAVEQHLAAARQQAGERLQQRGLAGAVGPEDHRQARLGLEARGRAAPGTRRSRRSARAPAGAHAAASERGFGHVIAGSPRHLVAQVGLDHRRRRAPPRAGVPSAILRPWCSTITRSTWRSSVRHRMLDPDDAQAELVAQAADQPRHRLDLGLGQAAATSSSSSSARPRRQRHADLEQALLRRRDRRRPARPRASARPISVEDRRRRRRSSRARAVRAAGRRTAGRSRTLSAHASCRANTRGVWKVRATPCAAKRCGARPVRSSPLHEQLPAGRRDARPRCALKKVVLPAPLGPMMPTSSPARRTLDASTATRPPKRTSVARSKQRGVHAVARFEQRLSRALSPLRRARSQRRGHQRAPAQRRQAARQVQHARISSRPERHHVDLRHLQPQRLGQQAEHDRRDQRPPQRRARRRSARSARSGSR